jgi:hypothetical protein
MMMDVMNAGWIELAALAACAAAIGCGGGQAGADRMSAGGERGFAPRQVSRVYTQSLAAPPGEILPLLTPIGEKAWAHGWDPVMLFEAPPPGVGTVFATRHHGQPDTIWLLDTFEPERVRYLHVTPGSDVTEIDIQLRPAADRRTDAEIRYTYTGFSDRGNALVDSWTEERYREFMRAWEEELNHYLAHRDRAGAP